MLSGEIAHKNNNYYYYFYYFNQDIVIKTSYFEQLKRKINSTILMKQIFIQLPMHCLFIKNIKSKINAPQNVSYNEYQT